MKFKLIWLITFITLLLHFPGFSQKWNWLIKGSIGQFYSSSSPNTVSHYNSIKLSGRLSYSQKIKSDYFKFQVKLKPEIFQGNPGFLKETFTLRSYYKKKYKKSLFNFGVYFSRQIFDMESVKNIYDYTNFEFLHLYSKSSKFNLISISRLGLVKSENDNPFKIIAPNFAIYNDYYFSSKLHVKGGIYFEYFSHSFINDIFVPIEQAKQAKFYKETKTGTNFELIYSAKYILQISYKILKVFPHKTNNNFYEQGFSGLVSFNFLKKCDAMFFAAYYIKHLSDGNLLNTKYLPMNSENKIYLKISYNFSKKNNIFINSGYFNDRLIEDSDIFSGMQASIGIELRK